MDLSPDSQALLSAALRAICLTRDYVGERLLPPTAGWEWFDAGRKIAQAIPDDEWAKQFWLRIDSSKLERESRVIDTATNNE